MLRRDSDEKDRCLRRTLRWRRDRRNTWTCSRASRRKRQNKHEPRQGWFQAASGRTVSPAPKSSRTTVGPAVGRKSPSRPSPARGGAEPPPGTDDAGPAAEHSGRYQLPARGLVPKGRAYVLTPTAGVHNVATLGPATRCTKVGIQQGLARAGYESRILVETADRRSESDARLIARSSCQQSGNLLLATIFHLAQGLEPVRAAGVGWRSLPA